MKKKKLIIIPARGGSKGIPRKNLRALNGKPLIYYSIINALSIDNADCYVSSNDDEILLIASKFGSKTLKRSNSISGDKTTLDPVVFNAYNEICKIEGVNYDLVITLQPTSPLLKSISIIKAIQLFNQSKLDTIISGVYDSHLTWIKEEENFRPNYKKRVNRQGLPQVYKETGGFVITKSNFVQENSRFGEHIGIFPLSKKEAIDIDDFDDWNLCEYYLKRKTILFVVAGDNIIGMGHVYNTLSIANEILEHRIIFLATKGSELALDKIMESNYEAHLQKEPLIIDDIIKLNPDIVINDILDTNEEYVNTLKTKQYKIINFEDLGSGAKKADLVVNAMYPENKTALNHYYGAKYFILRDEFLYTKQKTISKEVKTILISFGGVDPNNFTYRVLSLISEYCNSNKIRLTVIMGLGYTNKNSLEEKFQNIEIKSNISNISDEMYKADLVFTSAGRTTFEVASIGTPCIVLCQNKRETTHFFASEKNGFYNLGLAENLSDNLILKAFKECLDVDLRKRMHEKMVKNQLKKGKSRVIKLIKSTI